MIDFGPRLAVYCVAGAVYFLVGAVVVNLAPGEIALGCFRLLDRSVVHIVALEMLVEHGIVGRASELAVG
jgi:hypothetical protein